MAIFPVYILDKDTTAGAWVLNQLQGIGVRASHFTTVADLTLMADHEAPAVCLVALRPPAGQVLALITELSQEPRFAETDFILLGPPPYKRAAFEAGADDYLTTPPDVIELRKRVRLYLDRAELIARVKAETRLSREMEAAGTAGLPPSPDSNPVALLDQMAALTSERDRLMLLLRSTAEAMALVDLDGTVLFVNPAWERLTGYSPAYAVGHKIPWPPVTENLLLDQEIQDAIAQCKIWRGDVHLALNGHLPPDLSMTVAPAFDANHNLVGYVVTQHDISQRKADEMRRAKFLTDAVMEMRSPVTNIKMRQYLLREAPPDQRETHLLAFERATECLSRLVESMLELARLDADEVPFVREQVDLNRLLADAIVRYCPVAEEHGVTLTLTRCDALPAVPGDAIQLARVAGILIDNAILYTPEGGHVAVRLEHEVVPGGEFATIRVQDTGIGIAPEDILRLFQRFFRAERVRASGIRGVGLGLAIAREIINRHNGDITVESHLDQGSTFTVWLPIKLVD